MLFDPGKQPVCCLGHSVVRSAVDWSVMLDSDKEVTYFWILDRII